MTSSGGLRILLDEGLGLRTLSALEDTGADVKWIGEIARGMADPDILALANAEERIVVTLDRDFSVHVYRDLLPNAGVLWLRLGAECGANRAAVARRIVEAVGEDLIGAFSTYDRGTLKIRYPDGTGRDMMI